jgi:hypothetical protein
LKESRGSPSPARSEPSPEPSGIVQAWIRFWFSPTPPIGLHVLRFLTGILLIVWLITLAGHQQEFFGLGGWVDRESAARLKRAFFDSDGKIDPIVAANLQESYYPGWSLFYLFNSSPTWVNALYWGSIVVFALFALGLWTRITGVLTWIMVVSFVANPVSRLDAEPLLVLLTFYLMIGHLLLGQWNKDVPWSERVLGSGRTFLFGRGDQPPSVAANLAIRLLQIHFAIVVVIGGLQKLQSGDWWSGVAFWYPMHSPFETTPESLAAESAGAGRQLFFLSLAQYLFLAWQLGFPLFAWRRGWRAVLLGGAVIGWIGCLAIYQEPLFGPIYCIGALSFLTPAEWQGIADRIQLARSWFSGRQMGAPVRQGSKV